jgi:predicted ATPase
MITKAKFENYKLLRDVEFALGSLNVIVGANGVGKSSVLEAVSLLHALVDRLLTAAVEQSSQSVFDQVFRLDSAPENLISRPAAKGARFGVDVAPDHRLRLDFELGKEQTRMQLRYDGQLGGEEWSSVSSFDGGRQVADKMVRAGLGTCTLLCLDALRLREAHHSVDRDLRMAFNGSGLASMLQRIQIARDGRFEAIELEVTKVVPGAKRIRTTQEPVTVFEQVPVRIDGESTFVPHRREVVGAGFEVEWSDVGWVGSRHLSEGTLLVIGLVTLLHYNPPSLILLDDLDKGLHPTAQVAVVRMLMDFLARNPSVQVLATTHSPFVVDVLEPSQVLVAGSSGFATTIKALDQHPSWAKRKNYLQTGEFWSAVGEGWVAAKKE